MKLLCFVICYVLLMALLLKATAPEPITQATHIQALIDQGCERLDVVRRPNGSPTTAVFRCPGVSRLVVVEKHSH